MQPVRQTAIPILNTSYNPASFSYWVAQVIRPFVVSRQSVPDQEAAEWLDEFARFEESGTYFFSLTPVLTEAVKVALDFPGRPGFRSGDGRISRNLDHYDAAAIMRQVGMLPDQKK